MELTLDTIIADLTLILAGNKSAACIEAMDYLKFVEEQKKEGAITIG